MSIELREWMDLVSKLRSELDQLRKVSDETIDTLRKDVERLMKDRDEARKIAKELLQNYADFDTERELIERYPWIDYYPPE